MQDVPQALAFLVLGYAVAMPDHEGPDAEFLAGPQEGHATLDGIRAVHNFDTHGIGAANPVALYGYSGGANATAWAAQLQPSYAPDLHLAGAAIGGTPADPAATARFIDGGGEPGWSSPPRTASPPPIPNPGSPAYSTPGDNRRSPT